MRAEVPDCSITHLVVRHPTSSVLVLPSPQLQPVIVPVATKALRNGDTVPHLPVLLIYNNYRTSSSPTFLYISYCLTLSLHAPTIKNRGSL